jgi:hypothetical protein
LRNTQKAKIADLNVCVVGLFQIFIFFKNEEFLLEKNYTGKNYTSSSSSFSNIMANGKILAQIETLVLYGRPNFVVSIVDVMQYHATFYNNFPWFGNMIYHMSKNRQGISQHL